MPLDGKGNYRHNDQVARMHGGKSRDEQKNDILSGKKGERDDDKLTGGENMTEVHNHGDGTFHTVHEGQQEEHESIGHMHAHLSKLHGAPGEKHFHAHHDGFEAHSHATETGGEPEHQEHDPENIESLKQHLGQFFNEEEKEGGENEGGEKEDYGMSALGV